jgi:hypothetical protein
MICGVCGNPPRTYVYARPHTHARALTALLGETPQIPQSSLSYAHISDNISIRGQTMSENVEEETKPAESAATPAKKSIGKPFVKGASGNPGGRPRIEPRVRRYARRYDRRMCRALAEIAMDKDVPPNDRRKAAMDLVAIGSGRPALVQEVTGRDGAPVGPLVAMQFNSMQPGGQLSPADAYKLMCQGVIEADPRHPAFHRVIEAQPVATVEKTESGEPK